MSLGLGIALNVILDVGLLCVLAWAMARPRRLESHEPAAPNVEVIKLRGASVEVLRDAREFESERPAA
jgi:hypothetical protein